MTVQLPTAWLCQQGAKRFLSSEPNGRLTASRLRAGAWELFSLADIRAIASCRLPQAWAALLTTKSPSGGTPPPPPPCTALELRGFL